MCVLYFGIWRGAACGGCGTGEAENKSACKKEVHGLEQQQCQNSECCGVLLWGRWVGIFGIVVRPVSVSIHNYKTVGEPIIITTGE